MLSFLLGLLGQLPSIFGFGNSIVELLKLRQQASTDVEKAKIDEAIKQVQAQHDVILEAQKSSYSRAVYWSLLAFAAVGPIAYTSKIFLWDKTIGAFVGCSGKTSFGCEIFNTDALVDPNLWWITIAIFTFLFLTSKR